MYLTDTPSKSIPQTPGILCLESVRQAQRLSHNDWLWAWLNGRIAGRRLKASPTAPNVPPRRPRVRFFSLSIVLSGTCALGRMRETQGAHFGGCPAQEGVRGSPARRGDVSSALNRAKQFTRNPCHPPLSLRDEPTFPRSGRATRALLPFPADASEKSHFVSFGPLFPSPLNVLFAS